MNVVIKCAIFLYVAIAVLALQGCGELGTPQEGQRRYEKWCKDQGGRVEYDRSKRATGCN